MVLENSSLQVVSVWVDLQSIVCIGVMADIISQPGLKRL